MSLHKLHIFAKNRDAIAAQKGYTFQQLKTIEDWIENRIVRGNEEIYCDYEDDIHTRDAKQGKLKFKQIKLYSVDFSFSSESVKKAIAHFFMMYVKGEYSFDQVEFFFETNTSIVQRDMRENDAALLKEWHENQYNIGADLLSRIRTRVKKILDEYIQETAKELGEKNELKSDLQLAKNVYDGLKDEDFDSFIRCVKWQFDGVDSNKAVEDILTRIEDLIPKIPLPLDDSKTTIYSALLVNEVYKRSIQDDPEDRKLTKDLLDSILLSAGEEEDKWYADTFQQLKKTKILFFYPGEFQTVIKGAAYCRWNYMDEEHKNLWLRILLEYINLPETPVSTKRKAIYEYLLLKIGHNFLEPKEKSPLIGNEGLIKYYFENWEERGKLLDIEDDITLLQLIKSQVIGLGLPISMDEVLNWQQSIKKYLEIESASEKITDRLCDLLELQGHLAQQEDITDPIKSHKAGFGYYRKIPPLLKEAHYYSLARLYNQMSQMVRMLTEYGLNNELIDIIDEFMSEIQEYAEKTGLRHKAAHDLVERGVLHIGRHDFTNYQKALELFHKAKELWRLEYTKEGYVLSLLNISQVYSALGMSYASKYYALMAFWVIWHSTDSSLYKRLQQALALILHSDYKHGAWISAIEDFSLYLFAKREFDERGFEMDADEMYQKLVFDMSTVLHSVPLINPSMEKVIEPLKTTYGFIWKEQMQPLVDDLSTKIKDIEALRPILEYRLVDTPLNDAGPMRNIHFNAIDNDWHIKFANDSKMTPIGEEFVAFLQIVLVEISRVNPSVLKNGEKIYITVEEGHFQKENAGNNWTVSVPEFDSKEQPDIQKHYAYLGSLVIGILQSVSKLSNEEFQKFYIDVLLKKEKLGNKAFEASSYQRVFRSTIGDFFDKTIQRSSLKEIDLDSAPKPNTQWLPVIPE